MKPCEALPAETPASDLLPLPGVPVSPDEAARIWRELATGRWRVLAATDRGGARHVAIALAAAATTADWSCLCPREQRVVGLASRGVSQKVIGLELRLSPSTVSQVLRGARERLGFASFAQLARAYRANTGAIERPPPAMVRPDDVPCVNQR
jgi:DNA-binding NarL/FixJ family response regulator